MLVDYNLFGLPLNCWHMYLLLIIHLSGTLMGIKLMFGAIWCTYITHVHTVKSKERTLLTLIILCGCCGCLLYQE